jgi:hypothetical protein
VFTVALKMGDGIIIIIIVIVSYQRLFPGTPLEPAVTPTTGVPRGVVLGVQTPPPRNSEVLKNLGQIPSSVEYTSVTT